MSTIKVEVIRCDSCGANLVLDECTKKEMYMCTECSELYSAEEDAEECCPENTEDVEDK